MIMFWRRREVLLTYSLEERARVCDALRAVQCGGDPKAQVVRLQVSQCGALLLPVAAVIWAVYYLGLSV